MTNPYGTVLERLESPRETEARLLHRVSCDLEAADAKGAVDELAQAVMQNRRIWTIFAVDLGNEGNSLPAALKGSLLSIAGAVDRTCSAVLAGDKGAIRTLVEINRNIASALC
jgi:flagellar biosynthesis activator protein FlaF